jgi:transcriptional regulator with XRE-family HTH domain
MSAKVPDPVDKHVGSRLRMRRRMLRMTQRKLGYKLGLTFQQVHKYETGQNGLSAGRLQELSQLLQVPVPYFYGSAQNADDGGSAPQPQYVLDFLAASAD